MNEVVPANGGQALRIEALDVLRGFAILLILLMNIPGMGSYLEAALTKPFLAGWDDLDRTAWYASQLLFAGTQRGLLELLFGAGMVILTARAGAEGLRPYYRRYLWLIGFGLAHALLLMWPGDILFSYGIAALALPFLRHWPPKRLIGLGLLYAALSAAGGAALYADRVGVQAAVERVTVAQATGRVPTQADSAAVKRWHEARAQQALDHHALAEERAARTGSFVETWHHQVAAWRRYAIEAGLPFNLVEPFFTMLLGAGLFKAGVLTGARSSRFYLGVALVGYLVGLPLRWLAATEIATLTLAPQTGWVTAEAARLLVTLAHLSLVLLALRSVRGAALLRPFAAAGRTALSLYLLQSLLTMWIIFPSWGLGLWGELGYAELLGLAGGLILFQLLLANWWMRHFALGPAEWAWRSLSERRAHPIRLQAAGQMLRRS